MSLFIVEK